MREYAVLIGATVPTPVPVANTGGPGTRDGHWRESVFGNELLLQLAAMGIGVEGAPAHRRCDMTRPEFEVLPESAMV